MKKFTLFISLLCPILIFGQEIKKSSQNDDVVASFRRLPTQQLLDTTNFYFERNSYDTALIGYNLYINSTLKNTEYEQQIELVETYKNMANIYFLISDYRMAYDLLIKSLLICEKYNLDSYKSSIYSNIGIIYYTLNQYSSAQQYFIKSLDLCMDSLGLIYLYNNLGLNIINNHDVDSSLFYFNKALQISKQHNDFKLHGILNNFGSYYQINKQYDSAFHYFQLSYLLSAEQNDINVETLSLSDLGKLYFELNKIDSALYYIDLSNKIASENKFIQILANNHLTLSEIEKSRGKYKNALNHYITYTNLKDSIYNANVFGSINLLQRQYEVNKTNQQIEELEIDRQIKENTIRYQKIIQQIIFAVLFLLAIVLAFIIYQNKKLRKAYKIIVDKNVEIIQIEEKSEENQKKPKKSALTDNAQKELLNNILNTMDKADIICDSDFTVDKLAKLLKSNQLYVSTAINDGLSTNFRALLNKYRIREAQRLLSDNETTKYTIEFIANKVGFKSANTFRDAFNEITGVKPNFYLKSIREINTLIIN